MKIYAQDHNNILVDVIKQFEEVELKDAEVVVLWQDVIGLGKGIAKLAHLQKKPVIVCQHGIHSIVDYCPPLSYPLLADKICVWGPRDKEDLLRIGISKKRIELTGTTIFNHLKPKEKHKGINIIFRPAHWDIRQINENKVVAEALRKIKGINIITKLVETQDPEGFDNPIQSHRDEPGHLEACADVLSKADLVVAVAGDGTFEMMAYFLDIPVVIPDIWSPKFFLNKPSFPMIYTEACDLVSLSNLEKTIWENLEHPEKKEEERKFVTIQQGGRGLPGNPLDKIVEVIKTIKL